MNGSAQSTNGSVVNTNAMAGTARSTNAAEQSTSGLEANTNAMAWAARSTNAMVQSSNATVQSSSSGPLATAKSTSARAGCRNAAVNIRD